MEINNENQVENNGMLEVIIENWDVYSDNEHNEEKKTESKKEVKEPKKPILKDKYGEIIINKLDDYVEPVKQVKEARGDLRLRNNYNFGDLSIDEDESSEYEEKNDDVISEEEPSDEEKPKKKKIVEKKKNQEDLDDLLKEFGGNNK